MLENLKVLDVTLRDGGCVNSFNFGEMYIEQILKAQEQAGVDIIEVGYIDENKGSVSGRTQYIDEKVISSSVLKHKRTGTSYVAMIDYGKFDVDRLGKRHENGLDGIRMAFHKKNRYEMIDAGKKIISKGYQFYIQPMITFRYSDMELLELIDLVNKELPNASGFYIVDSFGEMRPNDMSRMLNLIDHNLLPSMPLGFHSHNNLQLAYSNAMSMLGFSTTRDFILDSSIMGMGKGAGNLNTELLLEHLNIYYGTDYNVAPLLDVIDKVINQLHNEYGWGYAPEYYLSSTNHCTPSYASHFYNKHMLPINQVDELLQMIEDEKKISFDLQYAEELYRKYNESKLVDDTETVNELRNELTDKVVLLVAPGKSISGVTDQIKEISSHTDVISIGLNIYMQLNYIVVTRTELFNDIVKKGVPVIVPSNICKIARGGIKILNYKNWIEVDELSSTHDSSAVMVLKLLQACGVKKIIFAGFDGFSMNINENYYDMTMRHPINADQAESNNNYYKGLIQRVADSGIEVEFMTASKYERMNV